MSNMLKIIAIWAIRKLSIASATLCTALIITGISWGTWPCAVLSVLTLARTLIEYLLAREIDNAESGGENE